MTVAKKPEPNSCKKWHLTKMTVAQKIWTKQRRKKMRLIKMTVTKKIGTRQLKTKKMAPDKNDCGEKNLSHSAR